MKAKTRNDISGILLLDKPSGITSNRALQKVKHLLNAKKAGHTGSLDPLATGMLPICFGEATKFSQYGLDADKSYQTTAQLGVITDTCDADGEVLATHPVAVNQEQLSAVLEAFKGDIEQIPPMYSALKHFGKRLYKLAREGIDVERQPRKVHIHSLSLDAFDGQTFTLTVHCSKGTYIRSLVADIGDKLGCGAHVTALRRLSVGGFADAKMYTLEALQSLDVTAITKCLLPIEKTLEQLPSYDLTATELDKLTKGQPITVELSASAPDYRLYYNDYFVGLGDASIPATLTVKRLLSQSYLQERF